MSRRAHRRLGRLADRLDESKIDQLRAWGTGLSASGSPDVRATGKAILMLIEEIERLHIDLWDAKRAREDTSTEADNAELLEGSLLGRLRHVHDRARSE